MDALDGRILLAEADEAEFQLDLLVRSRGSRNFISFCQLWGAADWFTESGQVPGTNPDAEGWEAVNETTRFHAHLGSTYLLNSFDNAGSQMVANIHQDIYDKNNNLETNAKWSFQCRDSRYSDGMVSYDVMAHEFTHGITWSTAGLVYKFESGALNESYSDIIASVAEGQWLHGDTDSSPTFRNLGNPHGSFPWQPDRYNEKRVIAESVDEGGVHINSGINNKAAYLIANGGSHYGWQISGIGAARTGQLFMTTLRTRLTSNDSMYTAAQAVIAVANELVAQRRHGFDQYWQACNVRNAFASVDLAVGDTDCDGILNDAELDNDNDGWIDVADNCRDTPNPLQVDTDSDSQGDACDANDDNDSFVDGADNCPLVSNSDQRDSDGNGIGDACDDGDGDGRIDLSDNCPANWNRDQSDIDSDGAGDECDSDRDGDGYPNAIDNCPSKANDQADDDGDLVGDVCDGCRNNFGGAVDLIDNDKDGWADRCDADRDGDTWVNEVDNCPDKPNTAQVDSDGDGAGDACDGYFGPGTIHPASVAPLPVPHWRYAVDVPACIGEVCAGRGEVETKITFQFPREFYVQLVDDHGVIVAHAQPAKEGVLTFRPDRRFTFTSGEDSEYSLGKKYRLEFIDPSEEVFEEPFEIGIGWESMRP